MEGGGMTPEMETMMNDFAMGLATVKALMEPLREAVEGYRAEMVRDGYPDDLARRMAADYHALLMRAQNQ
jgi:hypothetical protein